jgi:hypothetical protein
MQTAENSNSKLPELKMTKFNGNASNWLTYWNAFEAEIDKAGLTPTAKFAYLKEILEPAIRTEVDGLPFSYECAKTILKSEYGRQSEIVNAYLYVQNIMNLLVIILGHSPPRCTNFIKHYCLMYNLYFHCTRSQHCAADCKRRQQTYGSLL